METLYDILKGHPGPSVLLCALFFRLISRIQQQQLSVPKIVRQDEFRYWRWRNLSLSLVHSVLTGTWAVTCVAVWPEMMTNLSSYHNPASYLLVCVSSGYFVQDVGDIILSGHARGSWEFLLHHGLVIWCFLYALYTGVYVAGAVVALLVEVNSVTLHLRMLLKLAGAQSSSNYYIIKFVNLFTFVAFRLLSQSYLTWYIIYNYSRMVHAGWFLASLLVMDVMILIYFYRLLRTDFFTPRKDKAQTNGHQNGHQNGVQRFLDD